MKAKQNIKNCLQCIHFLKQNIYHYNKKGVIYDVENVMKCTRLNITILPRKSEEKSNEDTFIPNKCVQAIYFEESPKINIEKVICRDV